MPPGPRYALALRPQTRFFYAVAVQGCIDLIFDHLGDAVNLERLAGEACLSPFHVHRVFAGMLGEMPMQLIRRVRLERAAWHLVRAEPSVIPIAFDAAMRHTRRSRVPFTRTSTAYLPVFVSVDIPASSWPPRSASISDRTASVELSSRSTPRE